MGNRTVPVTVDVELDGLELDNTGAWLIQQTQDREIRVSREWTLAGEFGQLDRDFKRTARTGILETDELGFGNGALSVMRGSSQLKRRGCINRRH